MKIITISIEPEYGNRDSRRLMRTKLEIAKRKNKSKRKRKRQVREEQIYQTK